MTDGEFDNLLINNVLTIGADTNLFRAAADTLKTDDSFIAAKLQLYTGSEFASSAGDNFQLTTHTNTPNPNLAIGYGNGSGNLDTSLEYLFINAGYINLVNAHVKLTDGKALVWSDVNLYRDAPNVLKTDDSLVVGDTLFLTGDGWTSRTLKFHAWHTQINSLGAVGLRLRYWYADNAVFQVVSGTEGSPVYTDVMKMTGAGQLQLSIQGSSGGILIGGDVNLYRSAAGVLKTDDVLEVGQYYRSPNRAGAPVADGISAGTVIDLYPANYHHQIGLEGGGMWFKYDGQIRWVIDAGGAITETMRITSGGQLQLPASGSSGGIVAGSGASVERDASYVMVHDGTHLVKPVLPTESVLCPNPPYDPVRCYYDLGHGNIMFKHTGSPDANHRFGPVDNSGTHWGRYANIYMIMLQNTTAEGEPGSIDYQPMIAMDRGLWVEKDIQAYGALPTSSDPGKGTGGGAVLIGHGFWGTTYFPPCIVLPDSGFSTLHIFTDVVSQTRGHLDIGELTAHGYITSKFDGSGYRTYHGDIGDGGINIDAWGNLLFSGGSTSNNWNIINSWGNCVFRVPNQTGATASVLVNCNINPYPSGTNYGLGSGSNRWAGIVVHDIYYGSLHPGYDMIDDLAYAKQIQTINMTENGKTRQVIDPNTLKLFNAEVDETDPIRKDPEIADCTDLSKIIGFMLCCHKASALKLDEHGANFAEVAKLKDELAELRAQMQTLRGKTAA